MRIYIEGGQLNIEARSKATKMTRNKELKLQGMSGYESYEEGVNFMKNLKRETRKHKGKFQDSK